MGTPHPVDIYVGRRLRQRRTFLGLSQEMIGKHIGVTFQQIQKYERGINRMGSSRLYDFSKVLKTSIAYFFEGYNDYVMEEGSALGAAEAGAPAFEHDAMNSRETFDLMNAYYRIKNPAVRKRVVDLVKAMAAEDK